MIGASIPTLPLTSVAPMSGLTKGLRSLLIRTAENRMTLLVCIAFGHTRSVAISTQSTTTNARSLSPNTRVFGLMKALHAMLTASNGHEAKLGADPRKSTMCASTTAPSGRTSCLAKCTAQVVRGNVGSSRHGDAWF